MNLVNFIDDTFALVDSDACSIIANGHDFHH